MDNNHDKNSGFSRRKVLQTLGISAVGASSFTVTASAEETVTYPMLVSGDEVVKTIDVPESWDKHRLHARDVLTKMRDAFVKNPSVVESQLEAGEGTFGGLSGMKIVVLYDKDNPTGLENIPSEKSGIPIEARPMPEYAAGSEHQCSDETTSDNCAHDDPTDTVPGGYKFGSDYAYGSSCGRVTVNGEPRMLTVAHSFGNHCNDSRSNLIGTTAKVSGVEVGEVTDINPQEDWATVKPNSSATFQPHIQDGHSNPTVKGYVTRATLDAWLSDTNYRNPCLEKMGRNTGHTTGKIQATSVSHAGPDCTDFSDQGVKTYCNFAGGDSGSPTYFSSDGDAYITTVTGYGYNRIGAICNLDVYQYGNSGGTGAYQLAEEHSIVFGDNTTW